MKVTIATDGACKNNPGVGGWGVVVAEETSCAIVNWTFYGGKKMSTNNEMELTAIVKALEFMNPGREILLQSDSIYFVKGIGNIKSHKLGGRTRVSFDGWIGKWEKNGWRCGKRNEKHVKNAELWKEIASLIRDHYTKGSLIEIQHVKAHAGHALNEVADSLANKGVAHIRFS